MSRRLPARDERQDGRRAAILDAAAELFGSKGYEATTMQDLADRVGVLKGSLYYYIRSKEELLFELILETHETFTANLNAVQRLSVGTLERIWAFVYGNVTGNIVSLMRSAVFFREFRSLGDEHQRRIVELRDAHDRVLRELLSVGREEGVVRSGMDPKLTATAIHTMCNSVYLWYRPDGPWGPEDIARRYADLVVAAVGADADHGRGEDGVDADAILTSLTSLAEFVTPGESG